MAAINKIKVTSLLPTETIITRVQTLLAIPSFWLSFFWKKLCTPKKTEFEENGSTALSQCLDFYIETCKIERRYVHAS
jgi:hypothetical protein